MSSRYKNIVNLNPKQYKVAASIKRNLFFVGGVGGGKTFIGAMWTLKRATLVGSLGLITAPVSDTLTNSTLPALMDAWSRVGIYEGEHYVIGTRPPESWDVKPYAHRNGKILTWRWGSYVIVDGSDNFNKHRGVELDYVYIDEYRDVKKDAYSVYDGRLRGKAVKALGRRSEATGHVYQILATTTPPDDPNIIRRHVGDNTEIVYATSYDNQANLPEGYIDSLKSNYDQLTFDREVLGKLVDISGQLTYYAFNPQINVAHKDFDASRALWLAWDFNSSTTKPMSTLAVQEHDGKYYVVKEFIHRDSNTYQQSEVISQWLQESKFGGELTITGDYSGKRKESNASKSDYAIIEEYLGGYKDYRERTRPTLSIRDRVASLNAMFRNTIGEHRMFVSPTCERLIDDLNNTKWKESGAVLDDSDPMRTHPSDALSYFTYNFFPLVGRRTTTSEQS